MVLDYRDVLRSASEAPLSAKEATAIRSCLQAMGYPQPPAPARAGSSIASAVGAGHGCKGMSRKRLLLSRIMKIMTTVG